MGPGSPFFPGKPGEPLVAFKIPATGAPGNPGGPGRPGMTTEFRNTHFHFNSESYKLQIQFSNFIYH